ncbi:MAG: transcription termination/antitermination protein NusG [Dehalococcoidia bacterium]
MKAKEEKVKTARPDRRWYVVHTYAGYEDRVKKNLDHRIDSMDASDEIFEVLVPTEEEMDIREGQRRTVEKKVFPGYILVDMQLTDNSWHVVRNTPGVTGFVTSGDPPKPVPLDDLEVRNIVKQMEAEAPRVKVGMEKGQRIRIIDGPFTDFMGVVDELYPEKGKIKVLVSFFGRDTGVELDFLQVEKL